jgi:hypothetical protein
MKTTISISFVVFIAAAVAFAVTLTQQELDELDLNMAKHAVSEFKAGKRSGVTSENGYIPDTNTAVAVAIAVWTPIYGEKQIAQEHPIKAWLIDDLWVVSGSLPEGYNGGVAEAIIRKQDGQILLVRHGE